MCASVECEEAIKLKNNDRKSVNVENGCEREKKSWIGRGDSDNGKIKHVNETERERAKQI